jgi:MFS transporter, Spinster family, sphingosine-1-phosphate transporter
MKYRTYVITAIAVLSFMFSVDRVVITIFQESIKADFGLSDTQLGLLTGLAYALLGGFAGLPIARLADRWNRKIVLSSAFMLWTVMTAACGLAATWWHLVAARMGVGLGEAAYGPAGLSLIGDYYPREERARAIAISRAGEFLGVFGGLVAGGVLLQAVGWRAGFALLGIVGIVCATIFSLTVREPERVDERKDPSSGAAMSWRTMFGEPVAFALLVGAFTTSLAAGGAVGAWLPSYFARAFTLTPVQIGVGLGSCIGIASTIGTVVGGQIGNRYMRNSKSWAAAFATGVAWLVAPFFLGTFHAPTAMLAFGCLFMAFLIAGAQVGPILAMVQDLVTPGARATAIAVLGLAGVIMGAGVGPVIVGVISDWAHTEQSGAAGLRIALTCVASIYLLTGFLFFALYRRLRRSQHEDKLAEAPATSAA